MEQGVKTVKFEDCVDELKARISSCTLIPVIGSGFSAGSVANRGVVPSGKEMKQFMIDKLSKKDSSINCNGKNFSQIARYYNKVVDRATRKNYLADNFINVKLTTLQKNVLDINWPYIYTLNIDDAIEKNSDYIAIGPNKALENIKQDYKIVYKLHGNAQDIAFNQDGDNFSVFDTNQYIDSLNNNKWLLDKLKQDYLDKNMLFLGCSLDDEIDLMHVFSVAKQQNIMAQNERYFVTNKKPTTEMVIDLESYGITKIIIVDSYEEVYDRFYSIKEELKIVPSNELDVFKNIKVRTLSIKDEKNKDYLLFGKLPLNKKENIINLPYFFTNRNLVDLIVKNFDQFPLQFVYGKRVSGKSYLLLDIFTRIANRDKYYFDSRARISKDNIDTLFDTKDTVILIDTNVLTDDLLRYIIKYDHSKLIDRSINVIICVNTSSKESALELRTTLDSKTIQLHYIENTFENNSKDDEYEVLKQKLISINMPYFDKKKTILDSILWIQSKLFAKQTNLMLKDFDLNPDNYLQMAYLILLAQVGKLTSADLIKYQLVQESCELTSKLDKAVEPDYRLMITSSAIDNSYYQIVCNAQAWLLGYLSRISLRKRYFDTIIKAVVYIIQKMTENMNLQKRNKELFDFIAFDNLNQMLGGARKEGQPYGARRLIQKIYLELKETLGKEHQFNHQYAKCLLWGIERLDEPQRSKELQESLQSAILATQLIEEILSDKTQNKYLSISYSHIQFTLSMIYVKKFFFSKSQETFSDAVMQLEKALRLPSNQNTYELNDEKTDDENDFSVSKFMDYLITPEANTFSAKLKGQVSWLVTFRFNYLRNKN